jgi:ribosomal protein S18 acetylase RimI-like enzyme
MLTGISVRPLVRERHAAGCDAVVAALPEWFAVESGRRDCAHAVRAQDGLVAVRDDEVIGFVTWRMTTPVAAEITWLAVHPDHHRQGVGRALVEALATRSPATGARVLTAWTLSERDPDPGYARTRAAYAAMGFMPVAEAEIWGPGNPAVLLVRPLDQA